MSKTYKVSVEITEQVDVASIGSNHQFEWKDQEKPFEEIKVTIDDVNESG